jgi:aminoglycoside phosphotransferase (APT) family kinase protein
LSHASFSLQALTLRGGSAAGDRVLLLTDDVHEPSLEAVPHFAEPFTIRPFGLAGEGVGFDVVLADLDSSRSDARIDEALRQVRDDGLLILLDRSRSLLAALRDSGWALGLTGRPTPLPAAAAARLAARGLTAHSAFLADPGLRRLRHLVEPAFRSEIPILPVNRFRRWLLGGPVFYLQPRQKAIVARSAARPTAIDVAMRQAGGVQPSGEVESAPVRRCLLSGTHVMMFKVRAPGGPPLFFRFPLEPGSAARAADHYAMLEYLSARGYALSPQPVHKGSACGFPYFAEATVSGRNVSRVLPAMGAPELSAMFGAALGALEALHVVAGERVVLSPGQFDEYVGSRIEQLRQCLRDRRSDEGACAALDRILRREIEGREFRIGVCHGDAKLGNCLFDGSRVSGVIDWDMATPRGLCHVDIVALLTSTLLQRNGRSLRRLLRGPSADYDQLKDLVAAYCERVGTTHLSYRATVLLYWLDRVARHQAYARMTDRWLSRYVNPVMAELARPRDRHHVD